MEREEKKTQAAQQRIDPVEKRLMDMVDSGKTLDEDQIRRLLYSMRKVDEEVGENRRWYRDVKTYLQTYDGRYLCVEWEEGLTELQDDSYESQPYEVTLEEEQKLVPVIVRHWKRRETS